MTKQEVIQQAYGRFYNPQKIYYSINGWSSKESYSKIEIEQMTDEINIEFREYTCRPKSLQGIETNNGWIKIESEDDFDSIPNGDYHWFNIDTWEYESGDIPVNKYTHYQPILKPEKPLY